MSLKILRLILWEIWIKTIIIIIFILINMVLTDFNPFLSTTIFLLKSQLNFITTTSVTRLINKSCFQKLVTSLHKTSEAAFRTLANKLLFCHYSPILLPVRQESISLVLPILVYPLNKQNLLLLTISSQIINPFSPVLPTTTFI